MKQNRNQYGENTARRVLRTGSGTVCVREWCTEDCVRQWYGLGTVCAQLVCTDVVQSVCGNGAPKTAYGSGTVRVQFVCG
jgi:hypothetical protein